MDIYFTYESGLCDQYQEKPGGVKEAVTKVMAPLRVEGTGTEQLKLISGCNLFQGCKNKKCFYSSAGREQPRLKAKPKKKVES